MGKNVSKGFILFLKNTPPILHSTSPTLEFYLFKHHPQYGSVIHTYVMLVAVIEASSRDDELPSEVK